MKKLLSPAAWKRVLPRMLHSCGIAQSAPQPLAPFPGEDLVRAEDITSPRRDLPFIASQRRCLDGRSRSQAAPLNLYLER